MTSGDWSYPYGLFAVYGIELEYMIVDRRTLDVRPVCDALFRAACGQNVSDVEPDGKDGIISWSNELALHVVELKASRPVSSLSGLAAKFQDHVTRVNALLEPMDCCLLPTGMHPWLNADRDIRLWPHEYNEIYKTYDRIFGCNGHGWGNLQSTHINLPFANNEEFGRLHAAIRLILPLLPALAASSPIVDGALSRWKDYRLEVYRTNSERVPMMTGMVIPEPVFTREAYETEILGRLYADLAPLDPDGHLHDEFANARGAIARFDRGAIEIRVLDIQESPQADIALAALIVAVLKALVEERWMSYKDQQRVSTASLYEVFAQTARVAELARVTEPTLLHAFGFNGEPLSAAQIWSQLLEQLAPELSEWTPLLRPLLGAGSLASRITRALPTQPTRAQLRDVYAEIADCLQSGSLFRVS